MQCIFKVAIVSRMKSSAVQMRQQQQQQTTTYYWRLPTAQASKKLQCTKMACNRQTSDSIVVMIVVAVIVFAASAYVNLLAGGNLHNT